MIIVTSKQNYEDLIKKKIKKNFFYLGQWCKSLDDFSFFNKLDTLNYHWNDYKKREKDYKYIESIYEKLIKQFQIIFNNLHGTNFNLLEAEIFYGLWLKTYLIVSYDRWEIIKTLKKKKIKGNFYFKNISNFQLKNGDEFVYNSIQSDDWNDYFFYKILKFSPDKNLKINILNCNRKDYQICSNYKFSFANLTFKILDFLFHNIFCFKKTFNFSYLDISFLDYLKLILKSKNFSSLNRELSLNLNVNYDIIFRKKLNLKISPSNSFEVFLFNNIFLDIPSCFLENFNKIKKFVTNKTKLKNKIFITTHGHANREEYQLLVALTKNKLKSSSKLFIIQHGSGALPKYNSELNFSQKISNKFLTSGKKKIKENFKAFGQIFYQKFKYFRNSKNISLLLNGLPKRTLYMRSIPLSSGLKEYFKDQITFINSIHKEYEQNIYLKFYPTNYWNEDKFFINNFKNMKYYNLDSKIKNLVNCTRLFVNTSFFTPHNQLLSSNIPCIFFWQNKSWILQKEDEQFHNQVLLNKIYFDDPKKAANFINYNYDNIYDWWYSVEIQKIIKEYQKKYAYPISNKSKKIFNFLNSNIN